MTSSCATCACRSSTARVSTGSWSANSPTSAQRLIFLTGDTLEPATQAFLEQSGAPCLTKPFTHCRGSPRHPAGLVHWQPGRNWRIPASDERPRRGVQVDSFILSQEPGRLLRYMALPLLCFEETSVASWAMIGCLRRRR